MENSIEIKIIKELVDAIRYTSPRSIALNEAYHKAKEFLYLNGKNDKRGEFNKIDLSKDENGNLTATSFFSIPDRPDIPTSEPTKLN